MTLLKTNLQKNNIMKQHLQQVVKKEITIYALAKKLKLARGTIIARLLKEAIKQLK